MIQNRIKAVLFDMDGVLVDAAEWHYEALNKALGLFGIGISRYDHLVTYDGLPTRVKLDMLSRERGLPRKLHPFIHEMKQVYTSEIVFQRCKPRFQHQYALARFKGEGYRLAVCSNSIRETVHLMMTKAALIDHLDLLYSNEDVEKAKPDPEIYLKAMKALELKPEQCLIVEDNDRGVVAAKASGAHWIQIASVDQVNYETLSQKIRDIEANHA